MSRFCLGGLLILFCSCTTLRGSYQRVKVASTPSGAEIYADGERVGTTPAFVELKRRKDQSILLKLKGFKDREVPLRTSYRWGDSFAANWIWLHPLFWGAGVGLDLWNETAWDYEPLGLVKWTESLPTELTPMGKVAIAPPQAANAVLSDELAQRIQERIKKKYPGAQILNYAETIATFARFAYTHESKTPEDDRDHLYSRLGVSHLVESTESEEGSDVVIHSRVKDVFVGQDVDEFQTRIPRPDVRALNTGFWGAPFRSLVSFIPNNVGINWATSSVSIDEDVKLAPQYQGRLVTSSSPLSLLSGISLRNVKASEVNHRWRLTFRFVPSINIGYGRIAFDREFANALQGTDFDWYQLGAGFGPEVGLEMPVGFLYLDLIPSVGGSLILWSDKGTRSDARGLFSMQEEIGYLVFLSEDINLRVFLNLVGNDVHQWNSVMTEASGSDVKMSSSLYVTSGISVGYYFPEARPKARTLVQ